jgi:hypothetical protein
MGGAPQGITHFLCPSTSTDGAKPQSRELPELIWLISGLLLKSRYQELVFWLVAAGGAVIYWLAQVQAIRTYFPDQLSLALVAQIFVVIVVTITTGAYLFRRGGFLAALSLRYSFYLVWHIIWGGGIGLVRYFM